MKSKTGDVSERPFFEVRALNIDFSTVQPKPDYLLSLLDKLSELEINTLLVKWGGSYPWTTDFRLCTDFSFPEEVIDKFGKKAEELTIELIPFLPSVSDVAHVFEFPGYAMLKQHHPGRHSDSTILVPLLEEFLEDIATLLPQVQRFFITGLSSPKIFIETLRDNGYGVVVFDDRQNEEPFNNDAVRIMSASHLQKMGNSGQFEDTVWGTVSLISARTHESNKTKDGPSFKEKLFEDIISLSQSKVSGILLNSFLSSNTVSIKRLPLEFLWKQVQIGAVSAFRGEKAYDCNGTYSHDATVNRTEEIYTQFVRLCDDAWHCLRRMKEIVTALWDDRIRKMEQRGELRDLYRLLENQVRSLKILSGELVEELQSSYESMSCSAWLDQSVMPIEQEYYRFIPIIERF